MQAPECSRLAVLEPFTSAKKKWEACKAPKTNTESRLICRPAAVQTRAQPTELLGRTLVKGKQKDPTGPHTTVPKWLSKEKKNKIHFKYFKATWLNHLSLWVSGFPKVVAEGALGPTSWQRPVTRSPDIMRPRLRRRTALRSPGQTWHKGLKIQPYSTYKHRDAAENSTKK